MVDAAPTDEKRPVALCREVHFVDVDRRRLAVVNILLVISAIRKRTEWIL